MCCPPGATCRRSSNTPSHVLCCPFGWSCSQLTSAQCPPHTFQCPSSVGGGCCPVGLRCGSDLCLEYLYKTLALYVPLQIPGIPSPAPSDGENCALSTMFPDAQNLNLPASSRTLVTAPTCAWPNCDSGASDGSPLNLPISDRILGTPTAWRAKIGEIAVTSDADEGVDSKDSRKRMIRLVCITAGMASITMLMLVL